MKTIIFLNSTVVVLATLWFIIPYLKKDILNSTALLGFAAIFTLNFYFMVKDYTLLSSILRAAGFTSCVYVMCLLAIYFEDALDKK